MGFVGVFVALDTSPEVLDVYTLDLRMYRLNDFHLYGDGTLPCGYILSHVHNF